MRPRCHPLPSCPASSLGPDKPDKPDKDAATATSMVAVSTEAPPADDICYKRAISACCTETTIHAKKKGTELVCPTGTYLRTRCKGVGPKCK